MIIHKALPIGLSLIFTLLGAQEQNIILKTPNGSIEGTLLIPERNKPIPLVLIISGSGPTDRNGNQSGMENNSLKMLADELGKKGIASVRYDKRGVGQSSDMNIDEIDMRFDHLANDVQGWIEYLALDKRFSKIIVAGHSEGSLLGMVALNKTKKGGAFISIAGAGRPADEIIKEQLQNVPDKIKTVMFTMLNKLKKGDTIANVPPIYYALFRPSVQPYMISWFKYDPQKQIKKLKVPILIAQGSTDIQVTETDAQLLHKAKPESRLKIIQGMNHVLKDCESTDKEKQKNIYSDPVLPINTTLIEEIDTFIKGLAAQN